MHLALYVGILRLLTPHIFIGCPVYNFDNDYTRTESGVHLHVLLTVTYFSVVRTEKKT
jgi:hypothetical protein